MSFGKSCDIPTDFTDAHRYCQGNNLLHPRAMSSHADCADIADVALGIDYLLNPRDILSMPIRYTSCNQSVKKTPRSYVKSV